MEGGRGGKVGAAAGGNILTPGGNILSADSADWTHSGGVTPHSLTPLPAPGIERNGTLDHQLSPEIFEQRDLNNLLQYADFLHSLFIIMILVSYVEKL